jgi:hypothetical protein
MEVAEPLPMHATACQNIGPKERAVRVRTGWVGAAIALAAAGYMLAAGVPWEWRLLLFLPAAVSGFGFFQARANTCVAFAAANIKVLGDSRRERIQVTDEAERAAFKQVSRQISMNAILSAAAFTAVVALLP